MVVDEAHCVVKWGEEFRETYRRVGELRALVPAHVNVMALTATASNSLQTQCCSMLGISHCIIVNVSP